MLQNKKNIDLYENKNQLMNAAIDKMVVEIFNKKTEDDLAQMILLTGCSPIAGTTSTSIALAIAIANTQRRVLLVDCDVRKSLKYKKLNEETTMGLANYLLQDNDELDVNNIVYGTNIENLSYIPCGDYSENSTRILCSTRMENLIQTINTKFDCVIFDFPSVTVVPDAQILFQRVNGIVVLAALGETRKKQIKEAKMKIAPYAEKYYGMVVNKIPHDMYKQNVRDYDYYFVNKKGEQKLNGSPTRKKYKKHAKALGGK